MAELSSNWQLRILKRMKKSTTNEEDTRKFGTFLGVYVPCILMLFGVIIFLRLGWIVGLAGLPTTLFIMTTSTLIALITVLSMASIATNIEVKTGGIYYILSRSLGIEAGSAIGLPLFLKQSLTIAFCCIGFAESLKDLMPLWDITTIGLTTLLTLTLLASASTKGALKVQVGIFIAIIFSLISLFTGGEIEPMPPEAYVPAPLQSLGFWAIFAIFFPAMTGVESSVSLSGDLRNPSKSLPFGTITAILSAFAIYVSIAIFLTYKVPMDRLVGDPLIMQDLASIPSLIIVGIWGATLSSALGGLIGAPRTLQAMADDGIVPKIFSKTFGAMQEPRVATFATFAIAFFGIYFGSINVIAPLLTMICLICYAVVNLSAGIETLIANPSWRPRVRVHWAISVAGAALALIAMLMIEPGYALLALLLVTMIYFTVKKKQFQTSWVDIRQGILLFLSRSAIYRLAYGSSASKSWRPHFLVFTKFSEEHSTTLLKFTESISQSKGFLTMASFVPPGTMTKENEKGIHKKMSNHFKENNIESFIQVKETQKIIPSMHHMIKYYGLGPLIPNTIIFGGIKEEEESSEFVGVIQTAFANHRNVVIMNSDHDTNEAKKTPTNDIHLWWDNKYQDNSELMLVFSYMLQRNPNWKTTRIHVKAIVEDELQRGNALLQFQKLSIEKRLPLDIEILVSTPGIEERLNLVKEFSKNAEIVFMSLKPPPKEGECTNEYVEHLQTLSHIGKSVPSLALVLSSEHTPLEMILR